MTALTAGRRGLMGTVAALIAAPAVVAVPDATVANAAPSHPDAELILACRLFDATDGEYDEVVARLENDQDAMDEALRPINERTQALVDRLLALHALTPDGVLARARTLGIYAGHGDFRLDIDKTLPGRLVAVLLRDALVLSGLPVHAALREATAS